MRDFLCPHGFQYGTAAGIACRKSTEVLIQVPLDLPLGLRNKPQARAIAQQSRERADGKD